MEQIKSTSLTNLHQILPYLKEKTVFAIIWFAVYKYVTIMPINRDISNDFADGTAVTY